VTAGAAEIRRVEQVLGAIPGFAAARLEAQLSNGPTNASYLMEQAGVRYVLRLDKPEAEKLGLDRTNEKRVCQVAAAAGLTPEPLHFDLRAGVYLRRFEPGRSWDDADLASPDKMERLARLLRTLHGLPPVGAAFDPLAAARRYAAQLDSRQARSILRESERLMLQISAESAGRALCHNDLVCGNVLEGKRLMLIDWEYAGIGDPFFDLAVVVRHHGLGLESAKDFLRAYLGQSASDREMERLGQHCDFYGCLLELWKRLYP
jgi:thiamine kinase-like enzyme